VAPNVRPVVCKIMDYGRYLYEAEKNAREARKRQHEVSVKEVKLRPGIGAGDLETKLAMARRFLEQGKRVKVTVMFRRRELRRPENGYQLLAQVVELLTGVAEVEQAPPPQLEGRDLTMLLRQAR
jgi:translation initiation factor IF-3